MTQRLSHALARSSPNRGLAVLSLLALVLGGCVYRINIYQGNFLEAKNVDQLNVGMTRSQVRYLLGTPMVADAFNPDRWDYYYFFADGKTRHQEKRHFIVYFADDKVVRVEKPLGEFKDLPRPASPGA
jgi:outer membrane protein assembly factor BamE